MAEYNIFHELSYNWMIVVYFFLGGLAAGSFLLGFILKYWTRACKDLGKILSIVSPFILGLGMLFLLFELGKPFRFYYLFLNFVPTSAVSWGGYILNILIILAFLQAWFLYKDNDKIAALFGYLGIPFSLAAAGYTGIILAQMPGRPLWNFAFTPALFAVGAVISAIALAILLGIALGLNFDKLGRYLAAFIVLEVALVALELIVIGTGAEASFLPVLLSGPFAFWFWGIEIILGALVPVYILLNPKLSKKLNWQAIAAALVLVGIFAMRYIVVIGGQVLM
jgi:formate-dependent nitrite reductase membrane component NrfD